MSKKKLGKKAKAFRKASAQQTVTDTVLMPVSKGINFLTSADNDITYTACIEMLANYVSLTRFGLFDGSQNALDMTQYRRVLNIASAEGVNASTFWRLMELNRLHHGNAYAYIEWGKNLALKQLIALDPAFMRVYYDNIGILEGRKLVYEYQDNTSGTTYTFLPEELLHLKAFSLNGYIGRPAHEVLADTIKFSAAADGALIDTMERGYGGTCVLSYTSDLNVEKRKELLAHVKKLLSEGDTRMLPLPLGMNATLLSSNLESYYNAFKELSIKQISSFFGIPLFMLNMVGGSGNASMTSAQANSFYNATISPIVRQYKDELTAKLLTTKQINEGVAFDIDDIAGFTALSATERVDALVKMATNNILTPNEARAELGFSASEDVNADKLHSNGLKPLGLEEKLAEKSNEQEEEDA